MDGVDQAPGAEEQQRLEERVGEEVEDRRVRSADPERRHHVGELTDRGIREDAFDVVLNHRE